MRTNLQFVIIDADENLQDELNAHSIMGYWVVKFLPTRVVMARHRQEE